MLSNTLKKLEEVLKNEEFNLDGSKIELLNRILKKYDKEILPIDVVKDNLNLSYKKTNELFMLLARKSLVKLNYRVWCDVPNNNSSLKTYENIYDVPMDECEACEKGCKIFDKKIYIVYRVNLDE